jgi:hypothetical protein
MGEVCRSLKALHERSSKDRLLLARRHLPEPIEARRPGLSLLQFWGPLSFLFGEKKSLLAIKSFTFPHIGIGLDSGVWSTNAQSILQFRARWKNGNKHPLLIRCIYFTWVNCKPHCEADSLLTSSQSEQVTRRGTGHLDFGWTKMDSAGRLEGQRKFK